MGHTYRQKVRLKKKVATGYLGQWKSYYKAHAATFKIRWTYISCPEMSNNKY